MRLLLGIIGIIFLLIGFGILYAAETLPYPTPPTNELNMAMKAYEILNTARLGDPNKDKLVSDYNRFALEYENSNKKYNEEKAERKEKYNKFITAGWVMGGLGIIISSVPIYLNSVRLYTRFKSSRRRSREENSDSDGSDTVDS